MLLKIRNLLTPPEITRLTALSREVRFVEGRASNPANETKNNLQADTSDPKNAEARSWSAAPLRGRASSWSSHCRSASRRRC